MGLSFICRCGEVWSNYNNHGTIYGRQTQCRNPVGWSDCTKYNKEAGNEAVMSISIDDCIDLEVLDMLRNVGFGWSSTLRSCGKRQDFKGNPGGSAIGIMGLQRFIRSLEWSEWGSSVFTGYRWRSIPESNLWKGRMQSRFCERRCRGVESVLVDSFERSEIVIIRSCIMMGVLRIAWKRNWKICGEILGVHSQGDCGNVYH
ncbi:hypothetical protein Tco_1154038 [Tanacetum coccineum]